MNRSKDHITAISNLEETIKEIGKVSRKERSIKIQEFASAIKKLDYRARIFAHVINALRIQIQ